MITYADSQLPTISVLLPVWNGAECLDKTVAHILAQTFRDFELLILDDGSTDSSWDKAKEWEKRDNRVHALQNPKNLGIIASLYRLGEIAKGKYLAREDCGDFSAAERYELQVASLESNLTAAAAVSDYWLLSADADLLALITMPLSIEKALVENNPVCHPTLMMRTSAFKKAGGYSAEFAHVEDYDMLWRLSKIGPFAVVRKPLVASSLNPMGITFRNLAIQNFSADRVRSKYANAPEPDPMVNTDPIPASFSRAHYHRKVGLLHLAKGRPAQARYDLWQAMRFHFEPKLIMYYTMAMLPSIAIKGLKKLRGKPFEDSRTVLNHYHETFPLNGG